ncbi:MAG: hypothetical protein Q9180_001957 [Flavoplaca navasiana]
MAPFSDDYTLTIRQGPDRARVADKKDKERKPVDPPPIVQLHIRDPADPAHDEDTTVLDTQASLSGTLVSSLHRLKDVDNLDGGFFVFGDLSVKVEGDYRLRFSLYEMLKTEVVFIKATVSSTFKVWSGKAFPGMSESTFLSRSFGDQGVRLRIRKEPRSVLKRPMSMTTRSDDFALPVDDTQSYPTNGHHRLPLESQRAPIGAYGAQYAREGEPSYKRQRTSIDYGGRNVYDPDRHQGRPYFDPRAPLGLYNPRDQTNNTFNPVYSQAPQSTFSSGSDFTFGHQRTNSSNTSSPYTSSPYTSPHTEVSGHAWPTANSYFQSSLRDSVYNYSSNQYSDLQLNRQPQLAEAAARPRGQQSFLGRMPGNQLYTFPRHQDSESSTTANYSNVGRSMPISSSYDESSLRLPSTDQLGDMASSSRQQYPNTAISNVLPPLESPLGSAQSRGGTQNLLAGHIMPSIETQDLDTAVSQPAQERATESYGYNAEQ